MSTKGVSAGRSKASTLLLRQVTIEEIINKAALVHPSLTEQQQALFKSYEGHLSDRKEANLIMVRVMLHFAANIEEYDINADPKDMTFEKREFFILGFIGRVNLGYFFIKNVLPHLPHDEHHYFMLHRLVFDFNYLINALNAHWLDMKGHEERNFMLFELLEQSINPIVQNILPCFESLMHAFIFHGETQMSASVIKLGREAAWHNYSVLTKAYFNYASIQCALGNECNFGIKAFTEAKRLHTFVRKNSATLAQLSSIKKTVQDEFLTTFDRILGSTLPMFEAIQPYHRRLPKGLKRLQVLSKQIEQLSTSVGDSHPESVVEACKLRIEGAAGVIWECIKRGTRGELATYHPSSVIEQIEFGTADWLSLQALKREQALKLLPSIIKMFSAGSMVFGFDARLMPARLIQGQLVQVVQNLKKWREKLEKPQVEQKKSDRDVISRVLQDIYSCLKQATFVDNIFLMKLLQKHKHILGHPILAPALIATLLITIERELAELPDPAPPASIDKRSSRVFEAINRMNLILFFLDLVLPEHMNTLSSKIHLYMHLWTNLKYLLIELNQLMLIEKSSDARGKLREIANDYLAISLKYNGEFQSSIIALMNSVPLEIPIVDYNHLQRSIWEMLESLFMINLQYSIFCRFFADPDQKRLGKIALRTCNQCFEHIQRSKKLIIRHSPLGRDKLEQETERCSSLLTTLKEAWAQEAKPVEVPVIKEEDHQEFLFAKHLYADVKALIAGLKEKRPTEANLEPHLLIFEMDTLSDILTSMAKGMHLTERRKDVFTNLNKTKALFLLIDKYRGQQMINRILAGAGNLAHVWHQFLEIDVFQDLSKLFFEQAELPMSEPEIVKRRRQKRSRNSPAALRRRAKRSGQAMPSSMPLSLEAIEEPELMVLPEEPDHEFSDAESDNESSESPEECPEIVIPDAPSEVTESPEVKQDLTEVRKPWEAACHFLPRIKVDPEVREIILKIRKAGYWAYMVGGYVRDAVLKLDPHDVDLTTNCPADKLSEIIGRPCSANPFRTNLFQISDKIDISCASGTLEADLEKRDCTINSLIADEDGLIFDCRRIIKDFSKKNLVIINNIDERLQNDPSIIFRLICLASHTKKNIPSEYEQAMQRHAKAIVTLPFGIYLRHLSLLFSRGKGRTNLDYLITRQLLSTLLPEDPVKKHYVDLGHYYSFVKTKMRDIDDTSKELRSRLYKGYHFIALLLLREMINVEVEKDIDVLAEEAIALFSNHYRGEFSSIDKTTFSNSVKPLLIYYHQLYAETTISPTNPFKAITPQYYEQRRPNRPMPSKLTLKMYLDRM